VVSASPEGLVAAPNAVSMLLLSFDPRGSGSVAVLLCNPKARDLWLPGPHQ
jgi:hypothetical protein